MNSFWIRHRNITKYLYGESRTDVVQFATLKPFELYCVLYCFKCNEDAGDGAAVFMLL